MGQAARKLKPPFRPVAPSEAAVPIVGRQVARKTPPSEPQIIVDEPEQNSGGEWNRPDPNFVSMSQEVVGIITTRPAGEKEHPTASIKEEYSRPMPTDGHTTLLSGLDEERIQSPGTLNHAHIRELFLLHQGKAEGQEKPLDVECLAKRFSVDAEVLQQVFHHTSLLHFEGQVPIASNSAQQVKDNTLQQIKDTVQLLKDAEGFQLKEPT